MARGTEIIVSPERRGVFKEGYIGSGLTPKPGTVLQLKASVAENNGRFTYEIYAPGTDGDRRQLLVLLPDQLRGKLETDAYAAGDRCFLYVPVQGEELNVLFGNQSGTADDVAIGDLLVVDSGTGKVQKTSGTPQSQPFMALEAIVDPTADQLIHVEVTGF